ncbi:MAG: IS3 family transposase [Candidatus Moranbacteria bacterium]|nr:IS3 family transposase [Candidatus Moranbacteria bacterium]
MVKKDDSNISKSRKAQLLGISRNSLYYKPVLKTEDELMMDKIDKIDKIYTDIPFYGSRKISEEILRRHDQVVNRKKVQRLMRKMGIRAIYPQPKTSATDNQHQKYPYLLKNCLIDKVNEVWGTDITYIRLKQGFAYLVAIIDWFSRYVISWKLSESLETSFCIDALTEALNKAKPKIHNSDQGVQYTSKNYIEVLKNQNIKISMDGRGRCMDNIFTERLWRSVKYENVYIKSYENYHEAEKGLDEYFEFYNNYRIHQALGYKTPQEIYNF